MGIAENLIRLHKEIPSDVRIIAVSKTMPVSAIQEAYDTGQRDFGENKVQEMADKQGRLPGDIAWHMIGHLQTNKVKQIIPFVHLIHSVDSLKLLSVINSEAAKADRTINCLLQIFIASEETKFGLTHDEAKVLLSSDEYRIIQEYPYYRTHGHGHIYRKPGQNTPGISTACSQFLGIPYRFFPA